MEASVAQVRNMEHIETVHVPRKPRERLNYGHTGEPRVAGVCLRAECSPAICYLSQIHIVPQKEANRPYGNH